MNKLLCWLMLAYAVFSISKGYAQTKPTLTFNVICYIEEQTANYFGGKAAIQDSIIKQMNGVNQIFNANNAFNSTYNFSPVAFKYYKDNQGLDSTKIITEMPAETNYHYRVVYNAFPPNDSIRRYRVGFYPGLQSIIFSYIDAPGNGGLFGRIMTRTLAHEFGHSRGAYDLYGGNINGNQNSLNSSLSWHSPEPSIMNIIFAEVGFDQHSTYMINRTATLYGANTFSGAQGHNISNSAYPQTIGVSVASGNGWPIPNATVKFYGIPWSRPANFVLPTTPTYTLTTDNGGLAKFTGSANNPFGLIPGELSIYHTFFVTVTYGAETKYAWIPYYEVSSAFINGQSAYYKNIFVNTNGVNIAPTATVETSGAIYGTAPLNTAIPFYAYDLDGSISSVKVYDNGTYVGDATLGSDQIYWFIPAPLAAGQHSFKGIATDNSGATSQTQVLRIDVIPANALPSVSLSSPSNNATFTTNSVTISGTSSDSDGSITKVELYASGVLLTTITTGTSSFSYNWTNVPNGSYTISARAIDNKKGIAISTVSIKVAKPTCTAPQWSSAAVYMGGNEVVYAGIRYHANWWTQNEQPDQNNGPAGSGKPWTSLGTCNTRMGDVTADVDAASASVFPNPFNDQLNVETIVGTESIHIVVCDMNGIELLRKEVYAENGIANTSFATATLPSGVYIVKVVSGSKVVSYKVAK